MYCFSIKIVILTTNGWVTKILIRKSLYRQNVKFQIRLKQLKFRSNFKLKVNKLQFNLNYMLIKLFSKINKLHKILLGPYSLIGVYILM